MIRILLNFSSSVLGKKTQSQLEILFLGIHLHPQHFDNVIIAQFYHQ